MAEVLLLHHALGLTDGVVALADRLRDAGNRVTTPDLYEGRTFDDLDTGVAHAESIGFGTIVARGVATAEVLPASAVYIGMSLGALPAQCLAQTRPGSHGCILLHGGDVPVSEFGEAWPDGVPLQVHVAEADTWTERTAVDALVADAGGELFLYPGDAHLFTDVGLDVYDPASTDLVVQRMLDLLDLA